MVFYCAQLEAGIRRSTPAGWLMCQLMDGMAPVYVAGSEFRPLRDTRNLGVLMSAIRDEGARLNSLCFPAGPQTSSMVIIGEPLFLWALAERFGATVDPAALLPAVIDVDVEAAVVR